MRALFFLPIVFFLAQKSALLGEEMDLAGLPAFNVRLEGSFLRKGGDQAYVEVRWTDSRSGQESAFSLGRDRITWTHPGQETPLPSRLSLERPLSYGDKTTILFKKRGEEVRLFVDGQPVATAPLPKETDRLIWRSSPEGVSLSEPTLQPVAEIFFEDDFMRGGEEQGEWEILSGDWSVSSLSLPQFSSNPFCFKGTGEGRARAGYWFWENYRISAALRFADERSRGGLFVCGGEDEEGLLFRYRPGVVELVEKREDTERVLDEKSLVLRPNQWHEFSLCAMGSSASAAIDGCLLCAAEDARLFQGPAGLLVESQEPVFFDDVEAASIERIGPPRMGRHPPLVRDTFAGDRFMANWAKLSVESREGLLDYTFHRAPVDWQIQTGNWGIQSRWTCQPRWTWFGGQGEGTAAIWHKASFEGNIAVDVFAAFKMDWPFDPPYKHPGDINVTMCGDGENLASGYTFVYAGWNNTRSRLFKGSEVVAETKDHLLPDLRNDFAYRNLHIPWYHVRMAKQGDTVQCSVGDQVLLSYKDPDPLKGGRLALWTWQNGLLLARTRIEAETVKPPEPSDLDAPHLDREKAGPRALRTPPLVPGRPWRVDLPVDEVDLRDRGRLRFQFRASSSFKGNLYLKARKWLHCVVLTAPEVSADDIPVIGTVERPEALESWTEGNVDVSQILTERYGRQDPVLLEEAFLGLESDDPYVVCGFGGNAQDDFCEIRSVRFQRSPREKDGPTEPLPRIVAVGVNDSDSLWHGFEGETEEPGTWIPFLDGQGPLLRRDPWRKAEGQGSLRMENPMLGGAFGVWIRSHPLNPEKTPEFSFQYRTDASLRVDLRVLLGHETRTIRFTDADETWPLLGSVESVSRDNQWHRATVPLLSLLEKANLQKKQVTGLQFGSQGYPGNQEGQVLRVDDFSFLRRVRANAPFRVWWRSDGEVSGYSFHTDSSSETAPDELLDVELSEAVLEGHPPGRFWFHVRAVDENGRWGPPCHVELESAVVEDDVPPEATPLDPIPGGHGAGDELVVLLEDQGTGIDPSSIRLTVDGSLYHIGQEGVVFEADTGKLRWKATELEPAREAFPDGARVACRLTVEDLAGNPIESALEWIWRTNHALDETPPPAPVLSRRPSDPLFLFDFEKESPSWGNWGGCELRRTDAVAAAGQFAMSLTNLEKLETFYMALVDTGPVPLSTRPVLSVQVLPPSNYPESGVQFELVKLFFDGKEDTLGTVATLPADAAPGRWHIMEADLTRGADEGHRDPYGFLLGARRVAQGNEGMVFHVDNFVIASSENDSPGFAWSRPPDASGIAGYSWVLDKNEGTVPAERVMGTRNQISFQDLEPGTWWFHLRAVDNAGNWGDTSHLSVTIVPSSPQ